MNNNIEINLDKSKFNSAKGAINELKNVSIIGIGSGSTVSFFIEILKNELNNLSIKKVISTSLTTTKKLNEIGINPVSLNSIESIDAYIDGADEIDNSFQMIKGGGGALTMEKIVASNSKKFICIADYSKKVTYLGKFPIAIEIIKDAKNYVIKELNKVGLNGIERNDFITDNNNIIVDAYNLPKSKYSNELLLLEKYINNIPGVIENGLFIKRRANILILGNEIGFSTFYK